MSQTVELSPADEERLARYRSGAMSAAERESFERDAVTSAPLAEALYREASFDDIRAGAGSGATITPLPRVRIHGPTPRGRVWAGAGLALAACAAIVLGVSMWRTRPPVPGPAPGQDTIRGVVPGMRALAPAGDVASTPVAFVWTRDPRAESYRVEIFDESGTPVTTHLTADTTVSVERLGVTLPAAGTWRVTPIGSNGLERRATEAATWRVPAR